MQDRMIPPSHNICHFSKGISKLKRASGNEHAAIGNFLLGLIAGLPLSNGHSPNQLVCATWAILDFLYLAQLPSHNDETLQDLDDALATFHDNKPIFVDLESKRTSTSQNFTPSCTILHQSNSLEQQITTTQSTLSAYTLTLQRMPMLLQTTKMNWHRWQSGLSVRRRLHSLMQLWHGGYLDVPHH